MPGQGEPDYVAEVFGSLIADLQRGEVEAFEQRMAEDRKRRLELRALAGDNTLSAGELLKKIDGDPADAQRKLDEELERVRREAASTAARKAKTDELPQDHFPAPTLHVK